VKPAIISTLRRLDKYLIQDHQVTDYHLRVTIPVDENGDTLFRILRNLDILSLIQQGVPPEVVYLFIVHSILVPSLSPRERAQVPRDLGSKWTRALRDDFLSPLFFRLAGVLASYHYSFEIDGTIFGMILVYILLKRGELDSMLDLAIHDKAQNIWCLLGGPLLDFPGFAQTYHLPKPEDSYTVIQHNIVKSRGLLAFSHPIFDGAFPTFQTPSEVPEYDRLSAKFDSGTKILDDQHWHSQKSILPSHLSGNKPKPVDEWARRRALRSDQRFMSTLHMQASSLTGASGAILRQIVIPPVGNTKNLQQNRKVVSSISI